MTNIFNSKSFGRYLRGNVYNVVEIIHEKVITLTSFADLSSKNTNGEKVSVFAN